MRLILFLLLLFFFGSVNAQQSIPVSGGNATGTGGSVSYTVGQVVYTSISDLVEGSVAQGVQQPYEISVITRLEEAKSLSLSCIAYPNPASDFVMLKVENYDMLNISYSLFDINGLLLENKKVESNQTLIEVRKLVSSIYFLRIIFNNKEVQTFKIIKN